jgi:predicted esterase
MQRLRILAVLLVIAPCAWAEDAAYPPGRSSREIEGLVVELHIPEDISREKPGSLIVILHGAGGSATGMVGSLGAWVSDGYAIAAPKSSGPSWTDTDVQAALRAARKLKKELPIDPTKVHVVGFSAGGWALDALAFDDELHPCSATWVAAGCRTGSVPKWGLKGLGVLALAGTEDPNAAAARGTVTILQGKVRSVEARFEPKLGHEWPRMLMPYLQWWHGAMEGRFTPGVDRNFAWTSGLEKAIAALAGQKKGGIFVYAFSKDDADDPIAKQLQGEVFMDPAVRWYGEQLEAVKLDIGEHAEALAALGVKETPSVVVLKKDGTPKKVLGPKLLKARKLASALKSVAPDKKPAH